MEYSLFVLLIFFTLLCVCLYFEHEKINRKNKDSTKSLLNFLLHLALAKTLTAERLIKETKNALFHF